MSTRSHLDGLVWPLERVADALDALGERLGWPAAAGARPPRAVSAGAELIPDLAGDRALDAAPADIWPQGTGLSAALSAPALFELASGEGLLVLLGRRSGRVRLLDTGRGERSVREQAFQQLLWDAREGVGVRADAADPAAVAMNATTAALDAVLRRAHMSPRGNGVSARRLLVASSSFAPRLGTAWSLHPWKLDLRDELRRLGLVRRAIGVLALHLLPLVALVALWRHVGSYALLDPAARAVGGGLAWTGSQAIHLLSLLLVWAGAQVLASGAAERLTLDSGLALRTWLIRRAVRLDPQRVRVEGVGLLIGRTLEAGSLDALAFGGGLLVISGLAELLAGAWVLAVLRHAGVGAASVSVMALAGLVVVVLTIGFAAARYGDALARWSTARRAMTHDLIERMVGHRTMLLQASQATRAHEDNQALAQYQRLGRVLDRRATVISVGLPRLWLLVGLAVLALQVGGGAGSPAGGPDAVSDTSLATALGGIWLAYSGLRRLGLGLPTVSGAIEAWRVLAPLVRHDADDLAARDLGRTPDETGAESSAEPPCKTSGSPFEVPAMLPEDQQRLPPLLVARHLGFRYPGRVEPALDDATLEVPDGARILVEGPSGGGKSTLAAVLAGLRRPQQGRLAVRGVSQDTLGLRRWRGQIGAVPQFHDNHVLGANLLFNLLLGRRWPPRAEDVAAAEKVCHALGLGPLLERMPAGLQQLVGENGWQLSHGERSRVFLARSLLQTLELRILDETFAALDPETLDHVLGVVLARPEALIVIAHP